MLHKLPRSSGTLFFPSGRKIRADSIRRDLARKLCEPGVTWLKRTERLPREHADPSAVAANWRKVKMETSAIEWLRTRGMIETHPQDAAYYRWSHLHERPNFKDERDTHNIFGHRLVSLSPAQKMLLTQTLMATMKGRTHDVLAQGAVPLQRTLRSLERRNLVCIDKVNGVWKLSLAAHLLVPHVPTGTGAQT